MGEYFTICNFDRKEFLDAGVFGHGHKPGDFLHGALQHGVLEGLLHLLCRSGSSQRADVMLGRWAGERVAVVGDYYSGTVGGVAWSEEVDARIGNGCDGWTDISEHVVRAIGGTPDLELGPRSILHPDGTVESLGGLDDCEEAGDHRHS